MNFAKFLRTPFVKEHLWWLPLQRNNWLVIHLDDISLTHLLKATHYLKDFKDNIISSTEIIILR